MADSEESEKAGNKNATIASVNSAVEDDESQRPVVLKKYLHHMPWASAIELLGVLLTIIGATILVACINGHEQWPTKIRVGKVRGKELYMSLITPQVILSLTHSVIAFLIGLAVKDGITTAWWRRTLRGGTIRRLERDYRFGTSLKSAALSGKNINVIALATIGAAIAALSQGPLMQRALTDRVSSTTTGEVVSARIASEIPVGFTGISTGHFNQLGVTNLLTPTFRNVMKHYTKNDLIQPNVTGCVGTCTTSLRAAGFAPECKEAKRPYSFSSENPADVFSTSFSVTADDSYFSDFTTTPPSITLDLFFVQLNPSGGFTESEDSEVPILTCNGTLTTRSCVLRPALIEYPVIISAVGSGSVTIDPQADPLKFRAVSYQNLTYGGADGGNTTIGGIVLALDPLFTSVFYIGTADLESSPPLYTAMNGSVPMSYLDISDASLSSFGQDCNISFFDPTKDLISALHEITFRTAIAATNFSTPPYDSEAIQIKPISRYIANWAYLAASLAVTILGVAMIVPAFYGWWEIGRKVSLNPIEMAEAFNAPVLRQQEVIHKDADHLLELIGDRKVKYVPVEVALPGQEGLVQKMEIVNVDSSEQPNGASSRAHWVGGWEK
jgi:hypothetical protein